jgi:hypothetical protein
MARSGSEYRQQDIDRPISSITGEATLYSLQACPVDGEVAPRKGDRAGRVIDSTGNNTVPSASTDRTLVFANAVESENIIARADCDLKRPRSSPR